MYLYYFNDTHKILMYHRYKNCKNISSVLILLYTCCWLVLYITTRSEDGLRIAEICSWVFLIKYMCKSFVRMTLLLFMCKVRQRIKSIHELILLYAAEPGQEFPLQHVGCEGSLSWLENPVTGLIPSQLNLVHIFTCSFFKSALFHSYRGQRRRG